MKCEQQYNVDCDMADFPEVCTNCIDQYYQDKRDIEADNYIDLMKGL